MQNKQHNFISMFLVSLFVLILFTGNAFSAVAGDVDGSGEINLPDAVLALQVCAGMNPS